MKKVKLKKRKVEEKYCSATSEIANWRLVEGTCTTAERPLAAQANNKKVSDVKVSNKKKTRPLFLESQRRRLETGNRKSEA